MILSRIDSYGDLSVYSTGYGSWGWISGGKLILAGDDLRGLVSLSRSGQCRLIRGGWYRVPSVTSSGLAWALWRSLGLRPDSGGPALLSVVEFCGGGSHCRLHWVIRDLVADFLRAVLRGC
jgi:hypothetical protein